MVAKPANGVPITNLRIAKITIVASARPEQLRPNQVMNLSGISENERMPCLASRNTVDNRALDSPPNRADYFHAWT